MECVYLSQKPKYYHLTKLHYSSDILISMISSKVIGSIHLNSHLLITQIDSMFNTLRPRQNGRLFADENIRISIKISLKFVPKDLINKIPPLVLIMARRRPGDKPSSEPMMVGLLTRICVTRPQWVNISKLGCEIWWDLTGILQCDTWPENTYLAYLIQIKESVSNSVAIEYCYYDTTMWLMMILHH